MMFDIYQGKEIEVTSNGKSFLNGEFQGQIANHIKVFKDDSFILEWARPTLLFLRSIDIKYQNLPFPILSVRHKGLFGFELSYESNIVLVKMRPLRKAYYFIYFNGEKIGEVYNPEAPTLGYSKYTLVTNTDDETINLYVVLTFLLPLTPVN